MEIICYSCGRGEKPENTLEGITHCQAIAPDWRIEMDLRLTKDLEVILFHDENAKRTTGIDLSIPEATLSQIRQLNAGYAFHNGQPEQAYRVPLLKEVLEQFPQARLLLDVHTPDLRAVDLILDLIHLHEPSDLVIASEYDEVIAAFREKAPQLKYGAAAKEAKRLIYSSFLGLDNLFPLKGDVLIIPKLYGKITVLTPRIVKHVRKRHKMLWAWVEESEVVKTVEHVEDLKMLESLGADAAFCEFPERLKKELNA